MKKFIILLCMIVPSIFAFAFRGDGEEIIIHKHLGDGHIEHYVIADMPDAVYYDNSDDEIIIVADGTSAYYDVEIYSLTTSLTLISTQISGYGDTINVSSLPADSYVIVITTEYNNVYQGLFTIV